MTGSQHTEMPVFPLGAVLLPGQLMPLTVFEPRYRVLLFDLREAENPEFVVTLIERGSEVGGGDVRAPFGCVARILENEDLQQGRTLLLVLGTRRVALTQWLPEDPYPRAVTVPAVESSWPSSGPADQSLLERTTEAARTVGALVATLGGTPWPSDPELSADPVQRCWQLALLVPLSTLDRQRLLVTNDAVARWQMLEELVDEQHELLSARLHWHQNRGDNDKPGDLQ